MPRHIILALIFPKYLKMEKPFLLYWPCKNPTVVWICARGCGLPSPVVDHAISKPALRSSVAGVEGYTHLKLEKGTV